MNVKHICIICFQKVSEDLFSDLEERKENLQKISTCFQIVLDPDPEYPDISLPCAICQICVKKLNDAYDLRIQCVTINARFKKYCESTLKNSEDEVLEEVKIKEEIDTYVDSEPFKQDLPQNKFICDICKKVLKSNISLSKHMVSMHEKRRHIGKVTGFGTERQYHCTTCTYSTPHSQTLVNHMRRHNGERPFNCDCGKSFTQASSLAAHRKTHSNTTYFTCSQCGKQFKHAFSLKTHLQVHSMGDYSCTICNKVLKSKSALMSHMNRHYQVYNYNCEDCGDTFVTSAELSHHRIKHNAIREFKCHFCTYTSKYKKNLILHVKRHEGHKPFKCNQCQKAFLTKGNLLRHTRVHTREKPYSCKTCTQKFAYSSSLNNHMLTVHGVQYKWAEVKLKESRVKVHLKIE